MKIGEQSPFPYRASGNISEITTRTPRPGRIPSVNTCCNVNSPGDKVDVSGCKSICPGLSKLLNYYGHLSIRKLSRGPSWVSSLGPISELDASGSCTFPMAAMALSERSMTSLRRCSLGLRQPGTQQPVSGCTRCALQLRHLTRSVPNTNGNHKPLKEYIASKHLPLLRSVSVLPVSQVQQENRTTADNTACVTISESTASAKPEQFHPRTGVG